VVATQSSRAIWAVSDAVRNKLQNTAEVRIGDPDDGFQIGVRLVARQGEWHWSLQAKKRAFLGRVSSAVDLE
jgi:hypothetical protein